MEVIPCFPMQRDGLCSHPSPNHLSIATRAAQSGDPPKKEKKISRGLGSSCEENQGRITSSQMLLGSELLELALSAGYIQVIQYRDGSVPGRNCTPEDWGTGVCRRPCFPVACSLARERRRVIPVSLALQLAKGLEILFTSGVRTAQWPSRLDATISRQT